MFFNFFHIIAVCLASNLDYRKSMMLGCIIIAGVDGPTPAWIRRGASLGRNCCGAREGDGDNKVQAYLRNLLIDQ